MSLVSTPFLFAIISGLSAVLRAVWAVIAAGARQAAFYFATIVPMVLRWFLTSRAFMLTIVIALSVAFVSTFRVAFAVFNNAISLSARWAWLFSHFKWMTYILWDGPLNLREMYMRIPDVMGVWASLNVMRFMFTKLGWLLEVSRRNITFTS